ncbi:hypothetical protein JCM30471_34270 [Desulfuromonas carbonis]
MDANRYRYESPAAPVVSAIALAAGAGLTGLALRLEDAPLLVEILLWCFAVLMALVLLGTLLRTSVTVNGEGHFRMTKTLAGFPLGKVCLHNGEVRAVELHRTLTPGLEHANTLSSSPDKPRYRLEIVHGRGKHLVAASAGKGLQSEAIRLAKALDCPLEKTGDWAR